MKAVWITAKGDPLKFSDRKYLIQIYQDQHPKLIFMKAGQMGLSERGISEAIWVPEQLGKNVLYVFPAQSQLQDFVQARLDPVLAMSEYLDERIGESGDKPVLKVGLKRIGKGHLYLRGSQNEKQIITVDADMIILDERDRFIQENVPYIDKRLLASDLKWRREISTPTLPEYGIHEAYLNSDQRIWEIPCRKCGHWQELDFFKNIDFRKKLVRCLKCKKPLHRQDDGRWKLLMPGRSTHGYKINGIYNPARTVAELIEIYRQAKISGFSALQQFYNQVLGLPYEVIGQSLQIAELNACKKNYTIPIVSRANIYAGADVGVKYIHVIVLQKLEDEKMRVLYAGTVTKFFGKMDSLEAIMNTYGVKKMVVDKKPETKKVKELIEMFPDKIYAATYPNMKFSVQEYIKWDDIKYEVALDRTISLDYLISDIHNQKIELPQNIESIENFYNQMRSSVRVMDKGDTARWVAKAADHYLHTMNYARVAQSRGTAGKALMGYYAEPVEGLTPSFMDWLRINAQRIG